MSDKAPKQCESRGATKSWHLAKSKKKVLKVFVIVNQKMLLVSFLSYFAQELDASEDTAALLKPWSPEQSVHSANLSWSEQLKNICYCCY